MNMKKYIVSLMILFAVHGCGAMELAKLSWEDDEKCCCVARYLHKYPEGRNTEEKKKIDTFFSSEKTADKKNEKFLLCIDDYRNKIKNKEPFLMVAVCKELPFDIQKLIFGIIHQSRKNDFIDGIITAFERELGKALQVETKFLAENINLAKDFKSRMRNDLLELLKKPKDEKLTLTCSLYTDNPRWSPIQAINCAHTIGRFSTTEERFQDFLNTILEARKDKDIENLYIKFMPYLHIDAFFKHVFFVRHTDTSYHYSIL